MLVEFFSLWCWFSIHSQGNRFSSHSILPFSPTQSFWSYFHWSFFFLQRKLCEVNTKVSHEPTDSWSLVSSGLSALANMAKDTFIRKKIADEQDWWETSVKFLDCNILGIKDQKVRSSIYSLLGLLANISLQSNQHQKGCCSKIGSFTHWNA